ncbi:MAG: serine hydrolase domain-containing protein [Pseudomonadota bacterium]
MAKCAMFRSCILALAAMLPSPSMAQPDDEVADTEEARQFEQFLRDFAEQRSAPALAAMVLHKGRPVASAMLGYFDDEGELPTTEQTVFGIASVTKPITAAAMLRGADAGLLSLDTPLKAHPGFDGLCAWLGSSEIPFGGGATTADGSTIAPVACDRELTVRDALNMRVNGTGERYVYNPIIYARIDRALESAGLASFRDMVRQQAVLPAGMEHTALGRRDPESGQALQRLAEPFRLEQGRLVKASLPDDDFRAAAGIYTSVEQLARFDRAVDGGLIPQPYSEEIFKKPVGPDGDYRWGWHVQNWQGMRLVWHSGWEPEKYSALYLKVPDRSLTLIVLANTEAIWWGNPLNRTQVENSAIAAEFLRLYAKGK